MILTLAILRRLYNAQPSPLNKVNLLSELRLVDGPCGDDEFKAALQQLQSEKYISAETDKLTKDVRFSITAKGIRRMEGK